MRHYFQELRNFFRKGDMVLLLLCLVTTVFGFLAVASTTNAVGNFRYLAVQIGACAMGVLAYAIVSSIDADFLSEHRTLLLAFNTILLLMLIPFGETVAGNRSWLSFPFLPFNIQAAEICKITFVVIVASVMASHQNKISSLKSLFHLGFHTVFLVGLNFFLSKDAGVSLIFAFIAVCMAFAGGISLFWFLLGGGALAMAFPVIWNVLMDEYQRKRFEVLWNPELDPLGLDERYHMFRSLRSLTGGGMTGQGLFEGTRTQINALPAQHTDYIFSAIGEELGFVGCAFVLVMLLAIVARCIWVGTRSSDYMRRLICFGCAAALIFQVIINVGMCIGVTPVIGLTLPFVSYGGSSLVTLYTMMGLVSGVYARPSPTSQQRYIHPPV